MVRSIVIPKKKKLTIEVPDSFVGKRVEVIAFTLEDTGEEKPIQGRQMTKRFQAVQLKTQGFKFDREAANER